jgi:hypothetical protein
MTYRPIDIGGRAKIKRSLPARPPLAWVPISRLVIDEDYQRPLAQGNWSQILRIANAFDWAHFTPCLVAPIADNMFAIIDGQHRTHAAALIGLSEVPCMVVDLDEVGQARAFVAVNAQVTAVKPHHVFRAALTSGEPAALATMRVVEEAGARVALESVTSSTKRPRALYCVAFLWAEVKAGRADVLRDVLHAVAGCEACDDPWMWSYPFLKPFVTALKAEPRARQRNLSAFLDAHPPRRLADAVFLLLRKPEYAGRSHPGLLADCLTQLLRDWVAAGGGKKGDAQ